MIIIFGIFGGCFSHFHHFHICLFSISSDPNKSQICNFVSKSLFFMSSIIVVSLSSSIFSICVMYSAREREQRRILA